MPETPIEENEEEGFTHVGLKKDTKKKIAILAKVLGRKQFKLLAIWADDAWNLAKKVGLVTDAMLDPDNADVHWVGLTDDEARGMRRLLKKTNGEPKEKK